MSAKEIKTANKKVKIDKVAFDVPHYFLCPITGQVMVHPLKTRWGLHFEQTAILSWLKGSGTCPITLEPLQPSDLSPSKSLEKEIKTWRKNNGVSLSVAENKKNFKQIEHDISKYFLSKSPQSKEEEGIIDVVSPDDDKEERRKSARWSILRRKKCYASMDK
jgi:hypothetical protein